MMKMESTKSRRLRWLDCFLGPMNSNSKWLQENLEEINESVGRKLKKIEDSDADSFAEKVELYNESRQELNNLVDKCYKHGRGELLNNIPNSGLIPSQISISNVTSRPLLSKPRSSKQPNAPECSVVSKLLKRGVSTKDSKNHGKLLKRYRTRRSAVFDMCSSDTKRGVSTKDSKNHGKIPKSFGARRSAVFDMCSSDTKRGVSEIGWKFFCSYSDTESDDDDGKEGSDYELEADLLDMIEKLYIQMEWDRVVSMLQHRILRPYEDDGQVKESVSSNVDKALLEETLELHGEICRHLNEMSYLEEYNEEINATINVNPKKKCRRIE